MNRKEFIQLCGILGISTSIAPSLIACGKDDDKNQEVTFSGSIIVIGAGAGGMSAAYLLKQQGIEVTVLEASANVGGRMKIDTSFTDFPIPMGCEWIETNVSIFDTIVNDSSIDVNIQTVADSPDRKFVNYSWYQFYEDYILPSIANNITYNAVVQSIDYSGDKVTVNTANKQYQADKVIVSVPLQILRDGDINFSPALPQYKLDVINGVNIWAGFKAFFEFSTNFYGDGVEIQANSAGQKGFYDAAHGQNTTKHILGVFSVGTPAEEYGAIAEDQIKDHILAELDAQFNNQATPNYVNHITQNWNSEPYIRAGYLTDHADWKDVRDLGKSVNDKVYFSGGPFTDGDDWVSVHAAAYSAKLASDEILY